MPAKRFDELSRSNGGYAMSTMAMVRMQARRREKLAAKGLIPARSSNKYLEAFKEVYEIGQH